MVRWVYRYLSGALLSFAQLVRSPIEDRMSAISSSDKSGGSANSNVASFIFASALALHFTAALAL